MNERDKTLQQIRRAMVRMQSEWDGVDDGRSDRLSQLIEHVGDIGTAINDDEHTVDLLECILKVVAIGAHWVEWYEMWDVTP